MGDEHTIISVATDDMAVTLKRAVDILKLKDKIKKHWEITDHGPISWFLGFEIKQDQKAKTISINQSAYIQRVVKKFNLTNAKPVLTPMEPGTQFSVEQCPSSINQQSKIKGIPYSEAIGSVLRAAVVSRPDIAYTTGTLSQFIQNLGYTHWEGVKWIIVYLGSTKNKWLTFCGKTETGIQGYCDADWAGQKHRHSISGTLSILEFEQSPGVPKSNILLHYQAQKQNI